MIVEKQTQTELVKGKVYGFKLPTGEEVLGTVTSVTSTKVSVHKPHYLTKTPDGVMFAPAFAMMSEEISPVFIIKSLVSYYEPDARFAEAYTSAMSEVIVPDTPSIIT